jgi:D-glycero-D-manno-heptose 1,7-bisphosphate phosphatase
VHTITEPSPALREEMDSYKQRPESERDPRFELSLYTEDRRAHADEVRSLLQKSGNVVLQGRSYMTTAAYQARGAITLDQVLAENDFYPKPDLALFLLCDPKTAVARTQNRETVGGMKQSPDEYEDKIAAIRAKYEDLANYIPNAAIVPTDGSIAAVSRIIGCHLNGLLGIPMYKAIFLDKDGTLVDNSGYPEVIPSDNIYPETFAGLRKLQDAGYLLIIHSSQPWVARGRMTEEEIEDIFRSVQGQYAQQGITISHYGYCVHGRKGELANGVMTTVDCPDKKPNTGLIEKAMDIFSIDLRESYVVGDSDVDIEMGRNLGVKTCLVRTGSGASYNAPIKPMYDVENVAAFADMICR